ncbi:DNA helicase [Kipferlia bialata]|uniref:ATP-dependent DNA helicase n=1 Tax=Kipferlia bialata TaxID=797122 RepID=A0A9K3CS03_9EUKA|nr:DNA helicase [Kipferlia bialata]|eukprot:g3322.t1
MQKLRMLNSMVAFTSIYSENRLRVAGQGIPILQRNGTLRHRLAVGLANAPDGYIKHVHRLKLTRGKREEQIETDHDADAVAQRMMRVIENMLETNDLVTSYQRCRSIMMTKGSEAEVTMILPASRRERRIAASHIPEEYADRMRDTLTQELTPFLVVENSYLSEQDKHDIMFVPHDEKDLHTVHEANEFYEQLRYPLLFCQGMPGYYKGMVHERLLKRPRKPEKKTEEEAIPHVSYWEGPPDPETLPPDAHVLNRDIILPPEVVPLPEEVPPQPDQALPDHAAEDVIVNMDDHENWINIPVPETPSAREEPKKKKEKKAPPKIHTETVVINMGDYHRYILQERDDTSRLLSSGPLSQEFLIGCQSRKETVNLNYLRTIQDTLLYGTFDIFSDAVANNEEDSVGMPLTKTVLPSSYNLGPRHLKMLELNCKRLIDEFNLPTLFLTMTLDPDNPDLMRAAEKFHNSDHKERDDLAARVFNDQVKRLDHLINNVEIFGKTLAFTYRVEFQERNLPHIHALIWLEIPIITPDQVDEVIKAELPDPIDDPLLFELVRTHMMHGSSRRGCTQYKCGRDAAELHGRDPHDYFRRHGKCTAGYPKDHAVTTVKNDRTGYTYRRRITGPGGRRDNSRVIPYSPALLAIFQCPLNVEICTAINVSHYLHKDQNSTQGYIFKQPPINRTVRVNQSDEITSFDVNRVLGPVEAAWQIYGFPMGKMTPSVDPLPIHPDGQQGMIVRLNEAPTEHQKKMLRREIERGAKKTKVKGYMELMTKERTLRRHLKALVMADTTDIERRCDLKYQDVPAEYAWKQDSKVYIRRSHNLIRSTLGRVHMTVPRQGERHYMNLIAQHRGGIHSYEEWRTVKGTMYDTYQEAASAHKLLDDEKWRRTLTQACAAAPTGHTSVLIDLLAYIVTRQSVCTPGHLIDSVDLNTETTDDSVWQLLQSNHTRALAEVLPLYGDELKLLVLLDLRHKLECTGEWSKNRRKAMALDTFMLSNIVNDIPADFDDIAYREFLERSLERVREENRVKYHSSVIQTQAVERELDYNVNEEERSLHEMQPTLSGGENGQMAAYTTITNALESRLEELRIEREEKAEAERRQKDNILEPPATPTPRSKDKKETVINRYMYFVDGPGGSGKTYLLKTLIHYIRSQGDIVLVSAPAGIAASLLPGGLTNHAMYKIPIREFDYDNSDINMFRNEATATLLKDPRVRLLILDEAANIHSTDLEAINVAMQRARGNKMPFGGVVVVFSGDFRQILPVVKTRDKATALSACVFNLKWWEPQVKPLSLLGNMRVRGVQNAEFIDWTLKVGSNEHTDSDGKVYIPEYLRFVPKRKEIKQRTQVKPRWYKRSIGNLKVSGSSNTRSKAEKLGEDEILDQVIAHVFPHVTDNTVSRDPDSGIDSAILTVHNPDVDRINNRIVSGMSHRHTRCYLSTNSFIGPKALYHDKSPTDLNKVAQSGLQPHLIRVAVGVPIMLLTNMDVGSGHCNGTRYIVEQLLDDVIMARTITGPSKGKLFFIPRITVTRFYDGIGFNRTQFPIRVAYAMTINKAQGQSIDRVCLFFNKAPFSHGQTFTAISRVRDPKNLSIYLPGRETSVPNIVYDRALKQIPFGSSREVEIEF